MGSRTLITGSSDSGKSYLAQHVLAPLYAKKGYLNIVYTSTIDDAWEGCERHTSLEPFKERMSQLMAYSEEIGEPLPVAVWVDEADDVFSVSARENYWILKKGRHYFAHIFVITQRPKMVAPTVRGQCNELIVFSLKGEDAAELGRDFVADLGDLPNFRQGEYVHVYWSNRSRVVDRVDGFKLSEK